MQLACRLVVPYQTISIESFKKNLIRSCCQYREVAFGNRTSGSQDWGIRSRLMEVPCSLVSRGPIELHGHICARQGSHGTNGEELGPRGVHKLPEGLQLMLLVELHSIHACWSQCIRVIATVSNVALCLFNFPSHSRLKRRWFRDSYYAIHKNLSLTPQALACTSQKAFVPFIVSPWYSALHITVVGGCGELDQRLAW